MGSRRRPPATSRRRAAPKPPAAVATTRPPAAPVAFLKHVQALTNRRAEIKALAAGELLKLKPARGPVRPLLPVTSRVRRQARLNALQTWQAAAATQLENLRAGRTGSGERSQPLPDAHAPEVAKLKRRLVVGMSKNAAAMSTLEGAQRRWHAAAKSAREGIRLRGVAAREVLGQPLRRDARLHLKLSHATFMLEGNSPRLRNELRTAAREMQSSKGLGYWLARYEVMAGNYAGAADAVKDLRDYAPVSHTIIPMIDPQSANAPWLTWPCNFYTYRYSLAETSELLGMQGALAALSNDSEVVATWVGLGIPQTVLDQLKDRAVDGGKAIASLLLWNQANLDMRRGKYASAVANFEACQRAILTYFEGRYPALGLTMPPAPDESGSDPAPADHLENALDVLASALIRYNGPTKHIWTFFRERYMAITIEELHTHDWRRPKVVPLAYEFANPLPNYGESTDFATAFARMLIQMSILKSLQHSGEKVEEKIDAPLLAIALVFCPLGIAESNRLRRHFDKALAQCSRLLTRHSHHKILSEVVERPFVKILRAQILLDKADAQYKARAMAASPATNPDGSFRYQGLEAAETYQGVLVNFEDQGQYVNRVNAGVDSMRSELDGLLQHTFHPVAAREAGSAAALTSVDRQNFSLIAKRLTIETIAPRNGDYPDPDRRVRPHEPLIKIEKSGPGDTEVLLETNPVVYALIVEARSRLLQMESGLNYLGYSDDYVPPWRFQFLLDRARYFVEHAKNAQREYLNFLSNAEREEFQELTAAQNVELEKSNIRIETARVDQVRFEVEAAKQSAELANMTATHAQERFDEYQDFDEYADELFGIGGPEAVETVSSITSAIGIPGVESFLTGVGDFFSGGAVSNRKNVLLADHQRSLEKKNLEFAVAEAEQAADVSQRQLDVARAGLMVSGMQRAAALLRHEFALQNLQFLRNRTLNAELWYRLAGAIRSVADTYLRYGIEMAFLAEQAYEFEADKRINVIRFDYDVSDLGDMLAGDFLLRDLDTLEQDLIIGQRLRQQQLRYVVSLSREFPAALQELRENGSMIFGIRIEDLERRFPGMFNLRVHSVEVLPIALMDNTRFSLEVTHLGSGQVRLHSQPQVAGEILGADWLQDPDPEWSIRLRMTAPETAVFSGLTRQELAGGAFFASNQRGAFEGVPAASSWRIDMSMKENRVVPNSMADILVTFVVVGYYDPSLRDLIDHSPRKPLATTTWFSAHQQFPDAFYEFNRTGRMDWDVDENLLALRGTPGELRNVAVVCAPSQRRVELGRLICSYPVEFTIDASGVVEVLRAFPLFSFTANELDLDVTLNTPAGAVVTFDFGDGTGILDATALPHRYPRPGRYDVVIRIALDGRLTVYRAAVVVSRQHDLMPPCVGFPDLQTSVSGGKVKVTPTLDTLSGESLFTRWRIDGHEPDVGSNAATFTLAPGRYVLRFLAVRPLTARLHSTQRHIPTATFPLNGLNLATNRTFDVITGLETTGGLNTLGQHVFAASPIVPIDRWTLELALDDNPGLVGVSTTDTRQHNCDDLFDVMLALEYEARDA